MIHPLLDYHYNLSLQQCERNEIYVHVQDQPSGLSTSSKGKPNVHPLFFVFSPQIN